jgi:hypothetical protein
MHGLGLGFRGTGERVIERAGVARGQRLLHDDVDHRAILRVDADQRAQLGVRCISLKMVASFTISTLG